jgi:outer membrane receptor protein involved in Fe transport
LVFNIPFTNQVGTLKTSGIDLQLSASHEVADLLGQSGDWGALDANFAMELLTEFVSNTGATLKGYIDIVSPAVFAANDIRPNYKFNLRLGYTLGDWRAVVTWSEVGGAKDCATSVGRAGGPTRDCTKHGGTSTSAAFTDLRKYDRVDVALRWNITDKYAADFIVNNVFNVNPPLGPYSLAGGINTFNDTYDVLHTEGFIGLTAKL